MALEPLTLILIQFTGTVLLDQFALCYFQFFKEIVLNHQPFFYLLLLLIAETPQKILSDLRLVMVNKRHLETDHFPPTGETFY